MQITISVLPYQKGRSKAIKIANINYADDLDIVTGNTIEAEIVLHNIARIAIYDIGLRIKSSKTGFISINQGENDHI